jgi:Predicted transcriptional regulator
MKKPQTPIQIITDASRVPFYHPEAVKRLMVKLDLTEKSFALLMNVTPYTIRLWSSGAVQPCNLARRLMQLYEAVPELVGDAITKQEENE